MDRDARILGVHYLVDDKPPLNHSEWGKGYVDLIDFLHQSLREFFPGPPPRPLDEIIPLFPTPPPRHSYVIEVTHYLSLRVAKTSGGSVELEIDPYEKLVLGYKRRGREYPAGFRWFEFGVDETTTPHHLIHGSSLLGFHGDYDSLEKVAGLTKDDIGMGPEQLVSAIDALANTVYAPHIACALIVMTRMFADAIRDPSIARDLVATICRGYPPPPQGNSKSYRVSKRLTYKRPFFDLSCKPKGPASPPGRPLAEVFSVVIDNMIDRADLYGKIHVEGGFMEDLCIYNTGKEDSVSISAATSSSLLLTGPSKSINAMDPIGIYLVLKKRNKDDEVIVDDAVGWPPSDHSVVYDTLYAEKVSSKLGSATVKYVVLSHAVQATLEVTLLRINCGDEDNRTPATNIHGYIHAGSNCGRDDTSYWSVLFLEEKEEEKKKKKKQKFDNDIVLPSRQLISLSRSVVSVKLSCPLKVEAELFAPSIQISSQEHDYEIAKGSVEFWPQTAGTSEGNIYGKYGEIRVKVTWAEL